MVYFIHTFELHQKITIDEYNNLVHYFECYRCKQESLKKLHALRCTTNSRKGITLLLRNCSENEKKRNQAKLSHMLIVIVNPSKLLHEGCAINQINDKADFKEALEVLDEKLEKIFEGSGFCYDSLDDFTLQRVDITRDIDQIPPNISKALMTVLKRMRLSYGFESNEEWLFTDLVYAHNNSYNIVSMSRGVEFVFYNKYDAAIKQGCTKKELEYFKDTVRIELRCNRKYIRKKQKKGDGVSEQLIQFYRKARDYVSEIYDSMFRDRTDLCYLSYPVAEKYVKQKIPQPKRQENVLRLIEGMSGTVNMNLSEILSQRFPSSKTKSKVIEYLNKIRISPVMISDRKIPYIQSLDSLLEFEPVEDIEYCIYNFAQKKTRMKEVFLREKDE